MTLLHIIHNGGWQYFDAYHRFERGLRPFPPLQPARSGVRGFVDPVRRRQAQLHGGGHPLRPTASITVSPTYARQIETACDGLERILHGVIGINNAIGRDFQRRVERRFATSGFVENNYPRPPRAGPGGHGAKERDSAPATPRSSRGPRAARRSASAVRRSLLERMREQAAPPGGARPAGRPRPSPLLHDPPRSPSRRASSWSSRRPRGSSATWGPGDHRRSPVASGDRRGEELARGPRHLSETYPAERLGRLGFQDVSIPLLASDVFLMPSMQRAGRHLAARGVRLRLPGGGARHRRPPRHDSRPAHRRRPHRGQRLPLLGLLRLGLYDAMERCQSFYAERGRAAPDAGPRGPHARASTTGGRRPSATCASSMRSRRSCGPRAQPRPPVRR